MTINVSWELTRANLPLKRFVRHMANTALHKARRSYAGRRLQNQRIQRILLRRRLRRTADARNVMRRW